MPAVDLLRVELAPGPGKRVGEEQLRQSRPDAASQVTGLSEDATRDVSPTCPAVSPL